MSRGGARAVSGPAPSPGSGRSDARGLSFTALPNEGYSGEVPEFPLPENNDLFDRELELWAWAWSTPQAAAWALEPWRWHSVAMWVRTAVICESDDATAADKNSLHRFAEDIGLSQAGLARNGWVIASPEIVQASAPSKAAKSSRDRMKVVETGGK